MSDFFSLPVSTKASATSQKVLWAWQGFLLATSVGGFIIVVGEIRRIRSETAELLSRFHRTEQQVARLIGEIEAITTSLASLNKSATPARSRNARPTSSAASKAVESASTKPVPAQEQTTETPTRKKAGARRAKKQAPAYGEEPAPINDETP